MDTQCTDSTKTYDVICASNGVLYGDDCNFRKASMINGITKVPDEICGKA